MIQKWFNQLTMFYRNLKIKHKLFAVHFLIVLIVCSVSLAALQVALKIYDNLLYRESAKVLNLSTISVENEIKKVESFSYHILSHPVIQRNLERLKANLPHYERSLIKNELVQLLWELRFEKNILSVNLLDSQGNQYSGGSQIPGSVVSHIIPKAIAAQGVMVIGERSAEDSSLICARQVRAIRDLSLEPLGTLLIRVNINQLVEQYTGGKTDSDVNLLILSAKEPIYFRDEFSKEVGAKLQFKGQNGYYLKKLNGRNLFVAFDKSTFTGWTYVNILPHGSIFRKIILLRSVMLLIFGLLFSSTIYLSMRLAQSLTRPIEELTIKMKQVENGQFEMAEGEGAVSERTDEIGVLQKDFAMMIQKINTLIKEDYTKQILIKDAQFKALQAQINPHFLYNTLDSINWLAKINQQRDISAMVESLGNLLRSAISGKVPIITLNEEVQLLKDYLTIQKMRFGERLQFQVNIDEEWLGLRVPKLTLQPIVENSINYGLENTLNVCRIKVKAVPDAGCLNISVTDNGPGIPEELLNRLIQGEIKPKGSGMGLLNIDNRIKLIFGAEYGLCITSELGEGTTVLIRIPKGGEENV